MWSSGRWTVTPPALRRGRRDGPALRATVPAGDVRVPGPPDRAARRSDTGLGALPRRSGRGPRVRARAPGGVRRWVPALVAGRPGGGGLIRATRALASDDGHDCPGEGAPRRAPTARSCGRRRRRRLRGGRRDQPQALPTAPPRWSSTIPLDGVEKQIGLGEPGDQVVLGDWNCDGIDTPALYRRAAGEVQYFDVWPSVEQRSYQPDTRRGRPRGRRRRARRRAPATTGTAIGCASTTGATTGRHRDTRRGRRRPRPPQAGRCRPSWGVLETPRPRPVRGGPRAVGDPLVEPTAEPRKVMHR